MKERHLCGGQGLANWNPPICWKCKHYREDVTCAAFPEGIPAEILESEADHRRPYAGDHGIHFEPLPEKNGDQSRILTPSTVEVPDPGLPTGKPKKLRTR